MKATDSTRSAMRWLSCSLVIASTVAGCTSTMRYYVPSAGDSRLNTIEMKDQSDAYLRPQCPRLLDGGNAATGEARIMLEIDRSGAVRRARVVRSSGDRAIDDIFGALAARLQFDPPTGMTGETGDHPIYVGYSCSPQMAVTTLNTTGNPNPPITTTVPPPR
jgi:TonB family protein